jgi:CHAT domain-containing protein
LRREINDAVRNHLVTPADLRKAGAGGRLAFLASCLSARNEEYPGDDLMGVTRAFFASNTVDLIAGAWTVVSSIAFEFIDHFYRALLKEKSSTADAMLFARKAVATKHPDPFHWGVFIHMGGNCRILIGRK